MHKHASKVIITNIVINSTSILEKQIKEERTEEIFLRGKNKLDHSFRQPMFLKALNYRIWDQNLYHTLQLPWFKGVVSITDQASLKAHRFQCIRSISSDMQKVIV